MSDKSELLREYIKEADLLHAEIIEKGNGSQAAQLANDYNEYVTQGAALKAKGATAPGLYLPRLWTKTDFAWDKGEHTGKDAFFQHQHTPGWGTTYGFKPDHTPVVDKYNQPLYQVTPSQSYQASAWVTTPRNAYRGTRDRRRHRSLRIPTRTSSRKASRKHSNRKRVVKRGVSKPKRQSKHKRSKRT